MKIRQGFVSNSSSSSFIITDKNNIERAKEILKSFGEDYYVYNDVLYSSFIYELSGDEGTAAYQELTELSGDNTIEGEIGGPPYDYYDEGCPYIDITGELGKETVYLPTEGMTDDDFIKFGKVPYDRSSRLYLATEKFFAEEDSDIPYSVRVNDFISKLKAIMEYEDED